MLGYNCGGIKWQDVVFIALSSLSLLYTIYLEILAVTKFGYLPKIWPHGLLAEFKFGGLPECVLVTLKFGAA